jgi:hypothetical protein
MIRAPLLARATFSDVMVSAGSAGRPSGVKALSAGAQVVGAELVEPTEMDIQFNGGGLC